VETCPLYTILELILVVVGIENFFDFPLLLFVHDCWWRWRLLLSGDQIGVVCCGFEEADMEDWMEFDRGR
jgi:hypothetical protein